MDMTPEERREYSETLFQQHPEAFPLEHRKPILEGIVTLGMTPFEARLAGGAFSFKVVADKTKWPEGVDPLRVMWAQSMEPDASEIWMMFENSSQFPAKGNTAFRVVFEYGKAVLVQALSEETH